MRSSRRSSLPCMVLLALIGVAACGDSSVDPIDEIDLPDEMLIHAELVDQLSLFNHSAEANAVLLNALDATLSELSVPPGWAGALATYDPNQASWVVEPDPAVPAGVARVTWYAMSGNFVALPVQERGHIDLLQAGDPAHTTIGVTATGASSAVLADYVLTFRDTESASARTRRFEADGHLGDGTRNLGFAVRQIDVEPIGTGAESLTHSLTLTNQGFSYSGSVEEVMGGAVAPLAADLVISVTVAGAVTRLELALQGTSTQNMQGGGTLRHAGQLVADIDMTGTQMSFVRPDGRAYRAADQQKLGTLALIMLNPMSAVEPYFW